MIIRTRLFRRIRFCVLLTGPLLLEGCVHGAKITYYLPSGDGLVFAPESCFAARTSIRVEITQRARVVLRATGGIYNGRKLTWEKTPGTTLFGNVLVPAGVRVKFVAPTFTVHTDSGQEGQGTISEITRTLWYQRPLRGKPGGFSEESKTQTLSPGDSLTGWTADEMRLSGLIPFMTEFDLDKDVDFNNRFELNVPIENFVASSFTASIPDIAVNGQIASIKPITFTRVTESFWSITCP